MVSSYNNTWVAAVLETIDSYRRMIDGAVQQLSDEELRQRPAEGINSVAIILRHVAGNLHSRWTDFLTTDGEKADRDRDSEFISDADTRESLEKFWETGWNALFATSRPHASIRSRKSPSSTFPAGSHSAGRSMASPRAPGRA